MKNIVLLSSAHLHADAYIHELSTVSDARIVGVYDNDPARAEAVAWAQFTTPSSASEFNASWLGILCAQMAQAKGALRIGVGCG